MSDRPNPSEVDEAMWHDAPVEVGRPGVPLPSGFENGRRRRIELSPEAKARVQRAWEEFDRSQRIVARDGRNHVIG